MNELYHPRPSAISRQLMAGSAVFEPTSMILFEAAPSASVTSKAKKVA
jgi:hypothetical protein